jgi:hypothetical protein
MANISGVAIDLAAGQYIKLVLPVDNQEIVVTLEQKSGQKARFRIQAPADVRIGRPDKPVKGQQA